MAQACTDYYNSAPGFMNLTDRSCGTSELAKEIEAYLATSFMKKPSISTNTAGKVYELRKAQTLAVQCLRWQPVMCADLGHSYPFERMRGWFYDGTFEPRLHQPSPCSSLRGRDRRELQSITRDEAARTALSAPF